MNVQQAFSRFMILDEGYLERRIHMSNSDPAVEQEYFVIDSSHQMAPIDMD